LPVNVHYLTHLDLRHRLQRKKQLSPGEKREITADNGCKPYWKKLKEVENGLEDELPMGLSCKQEQRKCKGITEDLHRFFSLQPRQRMSPDIQALVKRIF